MRASYRCKTCADLLHDSDLYKHYFTCSDGVNTKDNRMQADPETILGNYERPRLKHARKRQKGYSFIEVMLVLTSLIVLTLTVLTLADYEILPSAKEIASGLPK